jgi:hypothetical protein
MPNVYQEYPKWIAGPDVIVQNAAEERCMSALARDPEIAVRPTIACSAPGPFG